MNEYTENLVSRQVISEMELHVSNKQQQLCKKINCAFHYIMLKYDSFSVHPTIPTIFFVKHKVHVILHNLYIS